ncbi:Uma2 family endonuclease [Streptomyces sp. NPDC087440]|uniref:Uma2 family endonuclease n=1 Tax=Streptomyces sp. NPDC087440 TaxID=3365790 RepID=UPI00381688DA
MTITEAPEGIRMTDSSDDPTLDMMFEWLEPTPEGYKVEIVEGAVYMSPQTDTHWQIIRRIVRALEDRFGLKAKVTSDVRIDFEGRLNGLAPDVVKLRDDARKDPETGRWNHRDIEFVAEVISQDTAANDYGSKKATYAAAGVPVYLIVDPYTGEWHLHTLPKDDEYKGSLSLDFGETVDMTGTVLDLTLDTSDFPRD